MIALTIVFLSLGISGSVISFLFLIVCFEDDYSKCYKISALVVMIVCLLMIVAGSLTFSYYEYSEVVYDEIYSIRQDPGASGSFVLGNGSIDTYMYYFMYIKTEYGFEIKKITTENQRVYVVETNDIKPQVCRKKDRWSLSDYIIIYVPEGTIVKNFILE